MIEAPHTGANVRDLQHLAARDIIMEVGRP